MTDDTLLRRVADELDIRSIVARLAQYADDGDLDDYVALFTEDAHWAMPGAPRTGRADIRAGGEARRATGEVGPGSNSRHMVTTVAVTADGSDTAVADSYFLFYVNTLEAPTLRLCGAYHDTFVRTAEGWKLARRDIAFG
jgi:uncharacterized protein (TIGR02246 family)